MANNIEQIKKVIVEEDPSVIDTFEIPEELAKELAEVLTKSSIRRTLMLDLVGQPAKYEEMEKLLIPIEDRATVLKNLITMKYVPAKYQSDKYIWNFPYYNGSNVVWIKHA